MAFGKVPVFVCMIIYWSSCGLAIAQASRCCNDQMLAPKTSMDKVRKAVEAAEADPNILQKLKDDTAEQYAGKAVIDRKSVV